MLNSNALYGNYWLYGRELLFKDIILENQLAELPDYFPRKIKYSVIQGKALAVIGIRRSGKTTFLRQIADERLRENKKSPQKIIYINFSDERLKPIKRQHLNSILDAFYEIFPDYPKDGLIHFFLDEIQLVEDWELFVDRVIRSKNHRVYISGSSSKLLSREIATAMRGRALSYEIFPFSFTELLDWEGINYKALSPKERGVVINRFSTFLVEGGFPEVVHLKQSVQRKILQEYYNVLLYKDIIERNNPSNSKAVAYAMKILINQVGSLYTLNKLTQKIRSFGLKVDKNDVANFIEWFHDSYLFFTVPIFSESVHRQNVNPRKIYCIDNGMVSAISVSISKNIGHLLENLIFLVLRKRFEKIYYFKDRYHHETDFVVAAETGKLLLYQVTISLQDSDVRKRELRGLKKCMAALGVKHGSVITLNEQEKIGCKEGEIDVLPAWKFISEPSAPHGGE